MHKRSTAVHGVPLQIKVLVSVDEAAAMLSVGRTLIYDLLASGDLVSVKIGVARRIPVSALHDFIERLASLQKAG
jgi:excisionase family DNA binding protein